MTHTITEKRWTDPFHGRRAAATCGCGWSSSGPALEVIDDQKRHLASTRPAITAEAIHRAMPVDAGRTRARSGGSIRSQPNKEKS